MYCTSIKCLYLLKIDCLCSYCFICLDIQCNYLTIPYNGEISSCSSGSTGMGYEGDTCSFTCNTGYELTGSNTRTCQSDGSWSGSDDVCRKGMLLNTKTSLTKFLYIHNSLSFVYFSSVPFLNRFLQNI